MSSGAKSLKASPKVIQELLVGPLNRIGAVVQCLDVGGAPAPEAAGFEAILSGMRDRAADDDALLDAASAVLDALYDSFKVAVVA